MDPRSGCRDPGRETRWRSTVATRDAGGMIAPQRRAVAVRSAPGSRRPRRRRRTCRRHAPAAGLAHHAVGVAVPHERMRRMVARHRSDPVRSSFRAADAAVPVVIPRGDLLWNAGRSRGRGRDLATRARDQPHRGASCQYLVRRVRLASVNGQPVALPDVVRETSYSAGGPGRRSAPNPDHRPGRAWRPMMTTT